MVQILFGVQGNQVVVVSAAYLLRRQLTISLEESASFSSAATGKRVLIDKRLYVQLMRLRALFRLKDLY